MEKTNEMNETNEKEQKKEFLKRVEIRTMQKDITKLRKIETEKEKERIMGLQPKKVKWQPKETPKKIKEKIKKHKKDLTETLIPKPLPKKLFPLKKILPRVIFVLIILCVSGFVFWLITIKNAPDKELITPEIIPLIEEETEEEVILPKEEIIEEEEEEEEPEMPKTPTVPLINERILDWGSHIPATPRTIDTIIVHSVYNALGGDVHSLEKVIEEFKIYGVAAHYLITRDGVLYRTALDEAIAYHAGDSEMPDGRRDVNNFSIGIELVNTKTESPTESQYQSLTQLVKHLQEQYNIPSENIIGHKDIAPERKTDPWNFDWEYFRSLI